jgi:hypothetical protein
MSDSAGSVTSAETDQMLSVSFQKVSVSEHRRQDENFKHERERSNASLPSCADQSPPHWEGAKWPIFRAPELIVIDDACFLIRNALQMEEQAEVFGYIQSRDRTVHGRRAMVPAPKTLTLSDGKGLEGPNLYYEYGEESVINRMVSKATAVLEDNALHVIDDFDVRQYKKLSMAAIQYESPDGRFPPHVDHCNDSFVYLLSIGCAANFIVKGPTMTAVNNFKLCSGDVLVFNASSQAAILHGVVSIDAEGSCPDLLSRRFPILRNHRFGVQCRMHF